MILNRKNSKMKRQDRALKRFLKSRKGRFIVIAAMALGVGIAIYYHSASRQLIGVFWSRCRNMFNPKPEANKKLTPLAENANKSPLPVWQKVSIVGITVITGLVIVRLYPNLFSSGLINRSSSVEIEVPSSPSKFRQVRQIWYEWRQPAGGIISISGVIIMPVFPITGSTLFITGWQMLTHPQY